MKRKVLIALVCAAVCLLLAGTALAVSSSDLGQFLTSVTITSVPGNNNDNYDIELEFAETEALQFDNDVSLLYTFPAGITIPEDSNTQTAISFSTNDTTYVVSGNAVQVDTSGNMTVNFNDSDPNFERLAEVANICFQVSIHAQISEAYDEIDWNGGREGQEITVTYADPVYTVTLDPGEGTGEPITYYSTSQSEIPGWHDAQNCQFYYEDNGSLGFRLIYDYCPYTFAGSNDYAHYMFDGWEGGGGYIKLSARQTTFTAKWLFMGYIIQTDGAARAYYYNGDFEQVFPTEAAEGTALSLMLDDSAVPETGYYFTGEFTLNGVSLGRETSEDGLTSWPVTGFTMPDEAVTVGAVKAARETLALSFALGETRALPMDAWMQLQYMEGEPPLIRYDEATGTEALDVNRDGKPDLRIVFDDAACQANLTRMPACAAFGAFSFAFSGPTDRYGTVAFTLPAPAFGPAAFTLPAALNTIEESAFEGNAAMTIVDANHVTAIKANAFKGCANLTQIRLPADCTIHAAAFTGCGTVLVFAPSGGSTEAACETMVNCVFCAFNN